MARSNLTHTRPETGEGVFLPSLQREMNRLLDQFRSGLPLLGDDDMRGFAGPSFPALDVSETEDGVTISAEVPGVKEDDLDVSISGDTLVLKGEKSADREDKQENYHLVERKYGSFQRRIPLGFVPEEGAVEAQFADGILTLKIGKPETAKNPVQKVQIKKS